MISRALGAVLFYCTVFLFCTSMTDPGTTASEVPHTGSEISGMVLRSAETRTHTEKGLQWQIGQKSGKFRNLVSAWRCQAGKIECILTENDNLREVREARDSLQNVMTEISGVYNDLDALLSETNEQGSKYEKFEEIEREHYRLIKRVSKFIRETEGRSSSGKSSSSLSQRTTTSKTRADAIAKAAALQAKLKFIDSEVKHKAELEKIQTRRELEMAEAQINAMVKIEKQQFSVLDEFQDESTKFTEDYVKAHANPDTLLPNLPNSEYELGGMGGLGKPEMKSSVSVPERFEIFNPNVSEFIPITSIVPQSVGITENTWVHPDVHPAHIPLQVSAPLTGIPAPLVGVSSNFVPGTSASNPPVSASRPYSSHELDSKAQVDTFAKVLAEQVNLNRLPIPEPAMFDGDPLKYPGWKCALDSLIVNKGVPPSEKIYYLKKYLTGTPKEALEGYFLVPTDNSYDEARKLLDERYGNAVVVIDAFRRKLEAWPKIQSNDALALRKYADFLGQCETAMQTVAGGLNSLNDTWENRKLIAKLPNWLVTRWSRFLADWEAKGKGFPPFSQFRQFVVKEANIACNPITSFQALKGFQSDDTE